jgi:inosine/xanthosine triphosphatase
MILPYLCAKNMKKIIVASTNPIKINAALEGFVDTFPDTNFEAKGISVPSGVSDQPMTSEETLLGAKNRAIAAKLAEPTGDFWVGLEGGVERVPENNMEVFAWMYIIGANGRHTQAKTSIFYLPPKVIALIDEGKELGEADDIVFKRYNSKQSSGSVGILTNGVIDRMTYYKPAIILALIPFLHPELYPLPKD